MPDRRPVIHACEDEAREALLKARETPGLAAVAGGAACLSLRWHRSGGAGMLISAVPAQLTPAAPEIPAVCWLPFEERSGALPAAEVPRTDEWRLHRDLYRHRSDVDAIVRCRPTYATAFACSRAAGRDGIPSFHPDLAAAAGGALGCVDCGLPGTSLQSAPLLPALQDRWACLLKGWGLLACGASPAAAAARALEIEALARIWWHMLQMER